MPTNHVAFIPKAKYIWGIDNKIPNTKMVFRKTIGIAEICAGTTAYISAETKYWLYINGALVVFEGGLFRNSIGNGGYADVVDITPYLRIGENVIAVLCDFFGNDGRNNNNSKEAYFLFECEKLNMYSDESFLCGTHTGYITTSSPQSSYLYGGHNVGYQAGNSFENFSEDIFDESLLYPASVYENEVWGELYLRPIPLHKILEMKHIEKVSYENGSYHGKLPYAMAFTPCIKLKAVGGEKLSIYTDRYIVNGGPGDEMHQYRGHRIDYICKAGENCFSFLHYLYGEELILTVDRPITDINLSYRETGYDTEIVGCFHCDCDITNRLVEKAARTLYVCMRDNFMDCPDRERGQWIGDVSVQVPQVAFVLDLNARKLLRKAILDFINLRKGDVLVGNVPGANSSELPSQSLNAISQWGLVAQYYKYTGDNDILSLVLEPAVKYLKLWDLEESGLVAQRKGNWAWYDHLYNCDEPVLENAWYYSALCFAKEMAEILNDHKHDVFIDERIQSIKNSFNKEFLKSGIYQSGGFADDRANAMAVLSGLCPKENYEQIRKLLLSVSNSTVYMENYVLTALCEMGYIMDAYNRMRARYYNLAVNQNTTLWEDFYILGTKNHAWSGAPLMLAFRYFAGINTDDGFETFTVSPCEGIFDCFDCTFCAKKGTVSLHYENGELSITNNY